MSEIEFEFSTETELVEFGRRLSVLVGSGGLITLSGDIGAGKTTLVRGLVQGAGYDGLVKSPTFSLVEVYELGVGELNVGEAMKAKVYHFDLYRLQDPEELETIGLRDYLDGDSLCLFEWPEKAGSFLPPADINIIIKKLDKGRMVRLQTGTDHGQALFEKLVLQGARVS